jgi:hypothetical protein
VFAWLLHLLGPAVLGFLAFFGLALTIQSFVLGLSSWDGRILFALQGLFLGLLIGMFIS